MLCVNVAKNTTGRIKFKQDGLMLYSNSSFAIKFANNPVNHEKKKNVEVDYNFIRKKVARKEVHPVQVHTKDQLADFLTNVVD